MIQDIALGSPERPTLCSVWHHATGSKVLIIAPAVGVYRSFYRAVAQHFREQGYSVITLDYYGMVKTPANAKDPAVRMVDWGYRDISAAIDYAEKRYAGQPIFFLGHSVAGQVFPLAPNSSSVTAACLVASQNASKTNWSGRERLTVDLLWRLTIPFCVRFLKSLPGPAYGGKHPLHPNVARDWAAWGNSPDGLLGVEPQAAEKYRRLTVPVKFLSFHDDQLLAPRKAVDHLAAAYGSAVKLHEHLTPAELGNRPIGHFSFFKKEFSFLWPRLTEWFGQWAEEPARARIRG